KDKADISGLFEPAGGTITWKLYDNGECKGTPLAEDEAKVTGNNIVETHDCTTVSSDGSNYSAASYSGDHNNSAVASKCEAEPVNVTPAGPAITTTQTPAPYTALFRSKDKADISGLFEPAGGTITWKLYDNGECKGTPLAEDEAKVTGN